MLSAHSKQALPLLQDIPSIVVSPPATTARVMTGEGLASFVSPHLGHLHRSTSSGRSDSLVLPTSCYLKHGYVPHTSILHSHLVLAARMLAVVLAIPVPSTSTFLPTMYT